MDVQDRVGELGHERGAEQTHEPGQADEVDPALLQLVGHLPIEGGAGRAVLVIHHDRLDPGRPRAIEAGGVGTVGDHHRNRRPDPAVGDGIDDRLQVAAAARDEDAESRGHDAEGYRTPATPARTRPMTQAPVSPAPDSIDRTAGASPSSQRITSPTPMLKVR